MIDPFIGLGALLAGRPGYSMARPELGAITEIGNTRVQLPDDFPRQKLTITGDRAAENFISIGQGCSHAIKVVFTKGTNNRIFIGGGNIFHGTLSIYVRGNGNLFFAGQGCNINGLNIALIGNESQVILGDGCLVSFGVDIRTHDQHGIVDLDTQRILNRSRNVHAEPFVWLGKDVSVHGGVTLGCGAILGERALVTRDVPRMSLAHGTPARIVREKVTWVPDWDDAPDAAGWITTAAARLGNPMPPGGSF